MMDTIQSGWSVVLGEKSYEEALNSIDPAPEIMNFPNSLCSSGLAPHAEANGPWTGLVLDPPFFYNEKFNQDKQKESLRIPFWLTPERKFEGDSWFFKHVDFGLETSCYRLVMERVHWVSELRLNGELVGRCDSLSTSHIYYFTASGTSELSIRINNQYTLPIGVSAHSISDHTQGNWNGAVGEFTLERVPIVCLKNVYVEPRLENNSVCIHQTFHDYVGNGKIEGCYEVSLCDPEGSQIFIHQQSISSFEDIAALEMCRYEIPQSCETWDEFKPRNYRLNVILEIDGIRQKVVKDVGFRDWKIDGTQFSLNGRKVFLRGTLECAVFPKTGYPPTDVASWDTIMKRLTDWGFNHIRFHSWCPPEAAFTSADRYGVFLQAELPMWCRSFGQDPRLEPFMMREAEAIIEAYGSHPSFVLFCLGNEPGTGGDDGDYSDSGAAVRDPILVRVMQHLKTKYPSYFYSAGAGWPDLPESDFILTFRPRCYRWQEGNASRFEKEEYSSSGIDYREDVALFPNQPMIAHESGEWCVYPDYKEIEKYSGNLKAKNLERCEEKLSRSGLSHRADDFHNASGKFQSALYREEIEVAQRTRGMAGYQILGLTDFPGQGTALVGLLDAFWDEKGYLKGAEHSTYCGPTVFNPLFEKVVYKPGETLTVTVVVPHYGPTDLPENMVLTWNILDDQGQAIGGGAWEMPCIETGEVTEVGKLSFQVPNSITMGEFVLRIGADAVPASSRKFWVMSPVEEVSILKKPASKGFRVIRRFTDDTVSCLEDGETILHIPDMDSVPADTDGFVPAYFGTTFWNTSWTRRRRGRTLGLWVDHEHPVFAHFPTRAHSDWHWWELVKTMQPASVATLGKELDPMLLAIDDYHTSRKLALLFEARVANGKYLFCGINLYSDLGEGLVRSTFTKSLESYLQSPLFTPSVMLRSEEIQTVVSL
jgi:hypothetical protein